MSVSTKIGCTAQTLHDWVKKAEIASGIRAGVPPDVAERLKALDQWLLSTKKDRVATTA